MMLVELQYEGVFFLKRVDGNLIGGYRDIKTAYYESTSILTNNEIVRNNPKVNLAPVELMEWNDGG